MILGNDISAFQGQINFDTYKNNANFVIVKASEGVGFTDPQFSRNQQEARRVGMPLGYYHFARPDLGNNAAAEADYFLSVIGQLQAGEVLALDYEVNGQYDVIGWCKAFLDEVQNKTGVKALIYLNQSTCQQYDWTPLVSANYGLWIAAYTGDPQNNNFQIGKFTGAVMQQWTDNQTVPGMPSSSDADVFFGDAGTFKKYGYIAPAASTNDPLVCDPQSVRDALVHGSTQWDATVGKYLPGNDAKKTDFPDVQRVIAGYQSRITDLTNQLTDSQKALVAAQTTATNAQSDKQRITQQLNDTVTLYEVKLKTVTDTLNAQDIKDSTYEKQLASQTLQITTLSQQKGQLAIDLATTQKELDIAHKATVMDLSAPQLFSLWIGRLFGNKFT